MFDVKQQEEECNASACISLIDIGSCVELERELVSVSFADLASLTNGTVPESAEEKCLWFTCVSTSYYHNLNQTMR